MRILAVSGSLRAGSSNTALLRAAVTVAPQGVEVKLYEGLGELPHFNPDLEGEGVLRAVQAWQQALGDSDAVVISTPEYAHGVPGVLKNALDWVTGSGELAGKPVALFNASSRSVYAQASLAETLTVMSARVVKEGSVTVQLLGKSVSASQIAADSEMAGAIILALKELEARPLIPPLGEGV